MTLTLRLVYDLSMSITNSYERQCFWVTDLPIVGNIQIVVSNLGIKELHIQGSIPVPDQVNAAIIPEQFITFVDDLRAYFLGEARQWNVDLDLSGLDGFLRDVLQLCRQIPYGQTRTYGDLAQILSRPPAAARAVGMCLAANPIPIIIPCHRVIGKDGKLHGYSGFGGIQTKAALLKLEGTRLMI